MTPILNQNQNKQFYTKTSILNRNFRVSLWFLTLMPFTMKSQDSNASSAQEMYVLVTKLCRLIEQFSPKWQRIKWSVRSGNRGSSPRSRFHPRWSSPFRHLCLIDHATGAPKLLHCPSLVPAPLADGLIAAAPKPMLPFQSGGHSLPPASPSQPKDRPRCARPLLQFPSSHRRLCLARAFACRHVLARQELRRPLCSCLPSTSAITMLLLAESLCRPSWSWSSRASPAAMILAKVYGKVLEYMESRM